MLFRPLIASILLAVPAAAQTVTASNVVDAVSGDWNGDGAIDRAVLIADNFEGTGSLYIFFAGQEPGSFDLVAIADHLVWSGLSWGTIPMLGMNESGELLAISGNDAVGRDRWVQQLTIVLDDGEFVVAELNNTYWDTLDMENYVTCQIDYMGGTAQVENVDGLAETVHDYPVLPVADWNVDQPIPVECSN